MLAKNPSSILGQQSNSGMCSNIGHDDGLTIGVERIRLAAQNVGAADDHRHRIGSQLFTIQREVSDRDPFAMLAEYVVEREITKALGKLGGTLSCDLLIDDARGVKGLPADMVEFDIAGLRNEGGRCEFGCQVSFIALRRITIRRCGTPCVTRLCDAT